MKRLAITAIGVCLGLAAAGPAAAGGVGVGLTGGTLGLGAEVSYPLTSRLSVRGMIAGLDFSTDFETDEDDLEYDGDLELRNAAALIDFHPNAGSFRLTGGLVINDTEVTGTARCDQAVCDFGDGTDLLGPRDRARATVDYPSASPYFGIGWGSRPDGGAGWAVTADIGVFYLGDPDATVTLEGPSSANPVAQAEAEDEEDEIEDELDKLSVYPVLMVGASYRF